MRLRIAYYRDSDCVTRDYLGGPPSQSTEGPTELGGRPRRPANDKVTRINKKGLLVSKSFFPIYDSSFTSSTLNQTSYRI